MSPSVNNQSGESLFATASSGYVNGYTITAGGSAYTEAPAVVISDPELPGGVTATATASLTGSTVTGITVTNPGSGYLSTPTATILRSGSDVTGNGAAVQFTLAEFNSELM